MVTTTLGVVSFVVLLLLLLELLLFPRIMALENHRRGDSSRTVLARAAAVSNTGRRLSPDQDPLVEDSPVVVTAVVRRGDSLRRPNHLRWGEELREGGGRVVVVSTGGGGVRLLDVRAGSADGGGSRS